MEIKNCMTGLRRDFYRARRERDRFVGFSTDAARSKTAAGWSRPCLMVGVESVGSRQRVPAVGLRVSFSLCLVPRVPGGAS